MKKKLLVFRIRSEKTRKTYLIQTTKVKCSRPRQKRNKIYKNKIYTKAHQNYKTKCKTFYFIYLLIEVFYFVKTVPTLILFLFLNKISLKNVCHPKNVCYVRDRGGNLYTTKSYDEMQSIRK